MHTPAKAITFDVDAASLASLREALPGWQINDRGVFAAATFPIDRNPGDADLLVVGVRGSVTETLGLCRYLAFCSSYSKEMRPETLANIPAHAAPLLVLVPPGQEKFVAAALKAGAHSCLMLPIHPQDVVSMLIHSRAGNQPGRHTLNLERAQSEDRWRDTGGEG